VLYVASLPLHSLLSLLSSLLAHRLAHSHRQLLVLLPLAHPLGFQRSSPLVANANRFRSQV